MEYLACAPCRETPPPAPQGASPTQVPCARVRRPNANRVPTLEYQHKTRLRRADKGPGIRSLGLPRVNVSVMDVDRIETPAAPRRKGRATPLALPWREALQARIAAEGLRPTARALDVCAETLRRAAGGEVLLSATGRAIAAALAALPQPVRARAA